VDNSMSPLHPQFVHKLQGLHQRCCRSVMGFLPADLIGLFGVVQRQAFANNRYQKI
jgi:hypothetical protein